MYSEPCIKKRFLFIDHHIPMIKNIVEVEAEIIYFSYITEQNYNPLTSHLMNCVFKRLSDNMSIK